MKDTLYKQLPPTERKQDGSLYRMPPAQRKQANAYIRRECCNYEDRNCMLLDDGDTHACPQTISFSVCCKWFRWAVLPQIGTLEAEIFRDKELKRCAVCGCSPASPLSIRLEAIAKHAQQFSVHALCDLLEVNRSAYYYHTRYAPVKTQLELEDEVLRPLIVDIFEKSGHRFGARKIRAKLMQDGHTISERRVHRLMHEMELTPDKSTSRLNSANDRQYKYYPNKLKRKFLTDAPNKVWVSDITYVKVGFDFMYLCVIVDLFARKVVGYAISENINTDLTMTTFRQAFASRGCPAGLLFHSNQGTQYTAAAFRDLLRRHGVQQSFSAPGSPHDNAVAESFFAVIKKEDFRRNFYTTAEELQQAMDAYVQFYNDYRPHQQLGFQTPNQAEAEYDA